MEPVKLIGDIITALTVLAVLGGLLWFAVSRLLPAFG
jgi:hypothetical protein